MLEQTKNKVENEILRQKEVKKPIKLIGTVKPQRGQIMWELNLNDGAVNPATYNEATVNTKGEIRKKLIMKDGFLYALAINKRNAQKKFLKMLRG